MGAPWAGQVKENGEVNSASNVIILEITDIWGADATKGSMKWKIGLNFELTITGNKWGNVPT